MVEESLFLRVQMKRLPRQPAQQLENVRPRAGREPALLRGLIRCAGCQHLMKPSMAGKGTLTYHCDGGKHRASGRCPSPCTISRHIIEPYVVEQILSADQEVLARLVSRGQVDLATIGETERALADAREDLEAIKANTRMAARNYDLWQQTVERAERAARDAQAAYDAALTPGPAVATARETDAGHANPAGADPLPDELHWNDLSITEQRFLIAGAIDCVFVRSGRGVGPDRRTLILWKGEAAKHDLHFPGKGRPAKGPAIPLEWDDPVAGKAVA
jgi:hypothetical protein